MRLASFNLENLFDRARALNLGSWDEGRPILELFSKVNALLNKPRYDSDDRKKILAGLKQCGVLHKDDAGKFVLLRQNRRKLLKRTNGTVEVVATGRDAWVGWLELKTEPVNEIASRMTARVVEEIDADVMGVIEVDNRIALSRFNSQVLTLVQGQPYDHVMVIDGNDDRGIDVGILSKKNLDIRGIRSHVDATDNGGRIFSRDCPEYEIELGGGERLLVLVNHLKSKGFGGKAESDARRRRQAKKVREIYDARKKAGYDYIAVIGDLNDTPDSAPLEPLLKQGSTLKEVSKHANYLDDGRPGTWKNGTASGKLDYILLSPKLWEKVERAAIFRKGVWGGKNGDLWPHFGEMKSESHAASDHAAIWVDLDL
jgi:endonuclease/exonuclease/phosphatase family metal-dependent hydrolase